MAWVQATGHRQEARCDVCRSVRRLLLTHVIGLVFYAQELQR